jgi:hypothetical protein
MAICQLSSSNYYIYPNTTQTFFLKFLHKKPDHVIFNDSIWVAQNGTHGNMQDIAVYLATLFVQAMLSIRHSKKPDFQNFPSSRSNM